MTLGTLLNPGPQQPLPRGTSTLALWWFLSGLSMLFGASMIAYIIIRIARANVERAAEMGVPAIPFGTYELPSALWLSTILVLAASVTIQRAVSSVRRERQAQLRRWTLVTLILGAAFCIIQTPSMIELVRRHFVEVERVNAIATAAGNNVAPSPLLGVIFVLILLHALHVVGGLIHLVVIHLGAIRNRYDHEFYAPVKHAALYWHFLDVVWILMFTTLSIFG
jgi:heme/copper-type cytochrome/quinol oxidase subunit 3